MLMPEMDAARETMNASQKEAEETYAAMVEEYQGKATQYQQKQATWTAAIRESKEKELYEIQNRIQDFQPGVRVFALGQFTENPASGRAGGGFFYRYPRRIPSFRPFRITKQKGKNY